MLLKLSTRMTVIRILDHHIEEFKTLFPELVLTREKNLEWNKDLMWNTLPEYKILPPNEYLCSVKLDEELIKILQPLCLTKTITGKTTSLRFREKPTKPFIGMVFTTKEPIQPHYPIYVISKGRWKKRYTVDTLIEMKVNFVLVVEDTEFKDYKKVIDSPFVTIIPFTRPTDTTDGGGVPVRNFVWEHSISTGHKKHWVVDDNIEGFFRFYNNEHIPVLSGVYFKVIEDYTNKLSNVKLSGVQYTMFCPKISRKRNPIIKNTRIYSCILIDNSLEFRWRGIYNEDTDLSLRVLKKGYGTVLVDCFPCGKKGTNTCRGGNTDSIYKNDGLLKKYLSLEEQHPDVTKSKILKDGRIHHDVNYRPFKNNTLGEWDFDEPQVINEYGMFLQ